jgi:hypothetical protein
MPITKYNSCHYPQIFSDIEVFINVLIKLAHGFVVEFSKRWKGGISHGRGRFREMLLIADAGR